MPSGTDKLRGLVAIDYENYQLHCYSPVSGMHVIDSNPDQCQRVYNWATRVDDRPIQEILPEMDGDTREQLITGLTKEEWDKIWKE